MNSLTGFGIPFILDSRTREEKIEEARRSGLIKDDQDLRGPKAPVLCCKRCGSTSLLVGTPFLDDKEKGCEIPYFCKDCHYEGVANAKIRSIDDKGKLTVDLIPDGLVGVVGHLIPDLPYGCR